MSDAPLSDAPLSDARMSAARLPDLDQTIPPWPGRTVEVGGGRVFVRSTPSTAEHPEPALFVHGLGGASTNWTDLAAQLAPWLDGEGIDLPGFGQSDASPHGRYSLRAQAQLVITYLERSGRGPVHLFGNSMGGAISIFVASSRPDLIKTLTLISPAVPTLLPNRTPGADPRLVLLMVPVLGGALQRKFNALPAEQRVRGTFKLIYADTTTVPGNRIDEAVREIEGRVGPAWDGRPFVAALRSIAGNYMQVRSRSMWARMGKITAPTLLIWGDQDRLVDVRVAQRAQAAITGSRLLVLPGIGHVAMMEDPQTSARAVLGLLEDVGAVRVGSKYSDGPVGP